ncbi:MAG: formylmethanofuran dehydrogenase subunit B, partial [Methanosarcinales archaeon]|nr:formylmethanofuran dehydrogenase subunit B [Methanosarcinales archaeon]
MAKGAFTPNGKKDRKMIVIDPRNTDTAKKADLLLQLKPGTDYILIEALRAIVNGHEDVLPDEIAGLPKEKVLEAAEMCKAAKFGVLYFGMGITQTRGRYKCGDNVSSLMSDLNQITKFVMIGMRGHYNVTGFGQVASWETGFPMAIDFSRGYPYYNPGETGTNDVLMRREVDAFITGAADPGAHFPQESVKHLFKIPAIQIDGYANPTTEFSDVVIPAAIAGVECDGTAYRMDCQPIRMKKLVETTFKSDEEILTDLINKVRELKGAEGAKGGA